MSVLTVRATPSHQELPRTPGPSTLQAENPAPVSSADAHAHNAHDPHQLPTFSATSPPRDSILYLPPLLSSLPHATATSLSGTATRLPSIDPASLSLHKALHNFRVVTSEYASVPYAEAFNWDELALEPELEREWYCVAFRSKRRAGSDGGRKLFRSRTVPES